MLQVNSYTATKEICHASVLPLADNKQNDILHFQGYMSSCMFNQCLYFLRVTSQKKGFS